MVIQHGINSIERIKSSIDNTEPLTDENLKFKQQLEYLLVKSPIAL